MNSKRKSFLIYKDSLNVLDDLTDEQAGKLFKAIKSHQCGGDFDLDGLTKIALSPFKAQFDRDNEKYEKLCEKNKLIAENRYKKKDTKSTTGNQSLPTSTKSTDNDSDSDSDSDNKPSIKHIDQSKIDREKLELDSFEYWWKSYPKKQAKPAALKAWKKTIKKMDTEKVRGLTNHIVDDCKLRIADLATGSSKFIGFDNLNASTYINQERYNDDI